MTYIQRIFQLTLLCSMISHDLFHYHNNDNQQDNNPSLLHSQSRQLLKLNPFFGGIHGEFQAQIVDKGGLLGSEDRNFVVEGNKVYYNRGDVTKIKDHYIELNPESHVFQMYDDNIYITYSTEYSPKLPEQGRVRPVIKLIPAKQQKYANSTQTFIDKVNNAITMSISDTKQQKIHTIYQNLRKMRHSDYESSIVHPLVLLIHNESNKYKRCHYQYIIQDGAIWILQDYGIIVYKPTMDDNIWIESLYQLQKKGSDEPKAKRIMIGETSQYTKMTQLQHDEQRIRGAVLRHIRNNGFNTDTQIVTEWWKDDSNLAPVVSIGLGRVYEFNTKYQIFAGNEVNSDLKGFYAVSIENENEVISFTVQQNEVEVKFHGNTFHIYVDAFMNSNTYSEQFVIRMNYKGVTRSLQPQEITDIVSKSIGVAKDNVVYAAR